MSRDPLANPAPLIRRVYAYVAYRIGDGADAEDVTSAAFERAFRYRSSFDGERGDVVSWLVGIARRCIVEHYSNRLATTDDVPDAEAPGDLEEDAVRRLDVAPLVAALDRRDRELIALRYGADLSARQIADVLGLRTNTVEVALHRVLARLRADLHRDEAAEAAAAAVRNAAATVVERTKFAKSDILGESAS